MKHVLFIFAFVLIAAQSLLAQDIIVTRQSERIDAKIMEVSETEIKYKKSSNPDGPVFVLNVDKIASIVYANGEVQVFEKEQQKATEEKPKMSVPDRKIEEGVVLFREGRTIVENKLGIYEPTNLKELLGDTEYDNYLYAQEMYGRGVTDITFGWIFTLGGITMSILGGANENMDLMTGGILIAAVADVLLLVGYIKRGIAAGRISRIAEGYNADAKRMLGMDMSVAPSLLLANNGTVAPGLGVSLRF